MTRLSSLALSRDANSVPIQDQDGGVIKATITFAGGTEHGIGDYDGLGNPFTIFTITGVVIVRLLAVCKTLLGAGATATLEVGIVGNTALLIAQTAADAIDANEIWHDATPDAATELASVISASRILANGQDIIGTVGTANITSGVIDFYLWVRPVSEDSAIVPA